MKKNTTHHGPQYQEDNSNIWMLLKKSLLGNQPYHHIDEFGGNRNGRGAWLALKAYYEGEDFVNRTTQECLTKLRSRTTAVRPQDLDSSSSLKLRKNVISAYAM